MSNKHEKAKLKKGSVFLCEILHAFLFCADSFSKEIISGAYIRVAILDFPLIWLIYAT